MHEIKDMEKMAASQSPPAAQALTDAELIERLRASSAMKHNDMCADADLHGLVADRLATVAAMRKALEPFKVLADKLPNGGNLNKYTLVPVAALLDLRAALSTPLPCGGAECSVGRGGTILRQQ